MKTLAVWLAKKYALSAIEDATRAKKDKIASAVAKVTKWMNAVDELGKFLSCLRTKLQDGVLEKAESEHLITCAENTIDAICKEVKNEG